MTSSTIIALTGLCVVLVSNIIAIAWGAAVLSTSVKNLTEVVGELKQLVHEKIEQMHLMLARMSVAENRLDNLDEKWDGIERRINERREEDKI